MTIFLDDGGGAVSSCVKATGSFSIRTEQPGLANLNRPVWILENKYPRLEGDLGAARLVARDDRL